VHHFLKKLGAKLGIEKQSISKEALSTLCNYSWPGNIRQLENEIERAVIVSDTDRPIELSDLSQELIGYKADMSDFRTHSGKLREIVARVESDIIRAALNENKWNILKTSEALGLTRKGLRDKIARYRISQDED
jgi:DNA-binding NtrC family response regulator